MSKEFGFILLGAFFLFFSCKLGKVKGNRHSDGCEDVDSLMVKARVYYDSDKYLQALYYFDKIINIDSTKGEPYYSRAYCLAMHEEYKKSNEDYLKSVKLGYKQEESYFNLGCNYATMFKDSMALVYFMKCYELNPHNKEAKGQILLLKGKNSIIEL